MRFIRLLRVVRIYKKANSEFNKLNDDNEFKRIVLRHRAYQRKLRMQAIEDSKRFGITPSGSGSIEINNSKQSISPPSRQENSSLRISDPNLSETINISNLSDVSKQNSSFSDNTLKQLVPQESRLSKQLSEQNQRNVILLVLTILFSIPFFNYANYLQEPTIFGFNIQLLANLPTNSNSFNETLASFVATSKQTASPVLYVSADGVIWKDPNVNTDALREDEKEVVSFVNDNNQVYFVVFDQRHQQKMAAALGMG